MFISATEARAAEHEASRQRLRIAKLLRGDEAKAPSSADVMRIRRVLGAAADGTGYDALLAKSTTLGLFECGALYFTKSAN